MKLYVALALMFLLTACDQKKSSKASIRDTTTIKHSVKEPQLQTDTLQYIHFEGNFDHWYGVFINASKDTVQFVVDDIISEKLKSKLVEVRWFTDTLLEAGDNDSKYAANRLKGIRPVDGIAYSIPVTEEKVVDDVKDLPEVRSNADQTAIAQRPTDEKEYYLVETGTRGEDNFSRLFMFRVYVYPKYEIKFYDPAGDTEMSLSEWRNKKQ